MGLHWERLKCRHLLLPFYWPAGLKVAYDFCLKATEDLHQCKPFTFRMNFDWLKLACLRYMKGWGLENKHLHLFTAGTRLVSTTRKAFALHAALQFLWQPSSSFSNFRINVSNIPSCAVQKKYHYIFCVFPKFDLTFQVSFVMYL